MLLGSLVSDTWEYDGSDWTQVGSAVTAFPREGHAMAYDLARQRCVMFGGIALGLRNDTFLWEPPAVATWTRHGLGCAGSAGTPTLDAPPNATPALGQPFPMQVTSLPSGSGVLLFLLGFDLVHWNGAPLPQPLAAVGLPGCNLWVEPDAHRLVPHSGASASVTLSIPATSALAGVVLGAQALVLDAAAPAGIGAASNAGILRLW